MAPESHQSSTGAQERPFQFVLRGRIRAFVAVDHAETVTAALVDGQGVTETESDGRGALGRFELLDGEGLVRPLRRGGVLGRVLPDWFLGVNRPRREFEIHWSAQEAGLTVPPLLGVRWQRRGPWYGGALATRRVDGDDILTFVQRREAHTARVLVACGRAVRALHDAGIVHGDLQVRNVLIVDDKPVILDFDKATVTRRVGNFARARNLLRLRRSIMKNGLHEAYFDNLLEGYGDIHLPLWLMSFYAVKHTLRDLLTPGSP